jgi:hypothetical protein
MTVCVRCGLGGGRGSPTVTSTSSMRCGREAEREMGRKWKKRAITALALQGVHHFTPRRHTVSVTGNRRKSKSLWMLLEVDGYVWCPDLNIVLPSKFLRSAYANGFTTRRMGLTWSGKYISLFLAVQLGEWLFHGRWIIVLYLTQQWLANC